MQGDRRASAGTIRVDGHTRGSQDSMDSGAGGFTVDTHGSVDRRSRNQTTTCGGWVEKVFRQIRSERCSGLVHPVAPRHQYGERCVHPGRFRVG